MLSPSVKPLCHQKDKTCRPNKPLRTVPAYDETKCIWECFHNARCEWYEFMKAAKKCDLFSNCKFTSGKNFVGVKDCHNPGKCRFPFNRKKDFTLKSWVLIGSFVACFRLLQMHCRSRLLRILLFPYLYWGMTKFWYWKINLQIFNPRHFKWSPVPLSKKFEQTCQQLKMLLQENPLWPRVSGWEPEF